MAGEALQMADELGLDELGAHALSTRGFSRVMIGDLDGLRDLQESVRVASSANSPQAARGYNNLASITADLGDLGRAFELYAESRRAAKRFGDALALRWLDVERRLRVLLAWELDTGPGSRRPPPRRGRGRARLAPRGGRAPDPGEDPARPGGRRAGPRVRREGARDREIRGRAADPLPRARLPGSRPRGGGTGRGCIRRRPGAAWRSGSTALADTRSRRSGSRTSPSPWSSWAEGTSSWTRRAARRPRRAGSRPPQGACSGDWRRAASTFSRIGSLPDEALARLRAAADLEAADAPEEAEDERRRASAFYREVEAVSYVGAVE